MNWTALPFVLTALSYLLLGLWVTTRRNSQVQILYGYFSLTTCLWQAVWAVVWIAPGAPWLELCSRIGYAGIVFVPSVFFHFIREFTGEKTGIRWLEGCYGTSLVLLALIWSDHLFLDGFVHYPWGLSVKAGPLHPIFSLLVTAVILRTLVMLNRMEVDPGTSDLKKRQTRIVKLATYVYLGGAVDLFSQYGIPVYPLSFIFSGLSVFLFGYAMFRYEFLKVAVAPESEEDLERRYAASLEMKRLGMAAAFPLVSQGELLGYLLLGEKMSEESYSKEDLLLLRIVANQAALAYQRVRYLEIAVHGARTEMLGEIAGGFAHEIKTPLANISLPAELSLMDLTELEQGKKTIEELLPELKARMSDIMQQTVKASEKIEAIRQFSKPGQIQLVAVDLSSILTNSIELLDHLLRRTNTRVRTDFPTLMSPIRGDAKQLEIVFVNLIKNAAEAMAQHPSAGLSRDLWLRGSEDANWVMASVQDSGPGIKSTEFGHLFEAYFTTKGSVGTGMGLFLARQVIKAHGGSIEVKSEEGKGTEFIIRLPKFAGQQHGHVHQAA